MLGKIEFIYPFFPSFSPRGVPLVPLVFPTQNISASWATEKISKINIDARPIRKSRAKAKQTAERRCKRGSAEQSKHRDLERRQNIKRTE